jgi:hypothetical protein
VRSKARDFYRSPLFRLMAAFADAHTDESYVLSAEHRWLHADDVVGPSERTLNTLPKAERATWGLGCVRSSSKHCETTRTW